MSELPRPPRFSRGAAAVLAMSGVVIGVGHIWRFPFLEMGIASQVSKIALPDQ